MLGESFSRCNVESEPSAEWAELSVSQSRFWVLQQIEPLTTAYNLPLALRLTGQLNVAALLISLQEIVRRHEILRTVYSVVDGEPHQRVLPQSLDMQIVDLQSVPDAHREAELHSQMMRAVDCPFDLGRDLMTRSLLFQLSANEHVLLLVTHHIATDGWSQWVVRHELSELYNAYSEGRTFGGTALAESPAQHRQFVSSLDPVKKRANLDYWTRQLEGAPSSIHLPADNASQRSVGKLLTAVLPRDAMDRLQGVFARRGTSTYMTVLAAYGLLLSRLAGQQDIVIGSPFANRSGADSENIVGPLLSMLPLRLQFANGQTFTQLVEQVKRVVLDAIQYGEPLIHEMQSEHRSDHDGARGSLFNCMLNFQNFPPRPTQMRNLTVEEELFFNPYSKVDLTTYVRPTAEGLMFRTAWQPQLFERRRVDEMLRQLTGLLEQVAAAPEAPVETLSLLTDDARTVVPNPIRPLPCDHDDTVLEGFSRCARVEPGRAAVSQANQVWTYGQLNDMARSVTLELAARGLKKGEIVAVRGLGCAAGVAALLGTMGGGAVVLPMDEDLPLPRQQLLMRESDAKWVVSVGGPAPTEHIRQIVVDRASGQVVDPIRIDGQPPQASLDAGDAAYVMFTSGTTGVPKGVVGVHRALSHFITWQRETFQIGPGDRVSQLTSPSFDVYLREVFLALTSGATLCLPDAEDAASFDVIRWLREDQVTVLHAVPSLAAAWLADAGQDSQLPDCRHVFFAGEHLLGPFLDSWRQATNPTARLVNLYGPTETTLAKFFDVTDVVPEPGSQPVSPLPDCQGLLLNSANQQCGIGEVGEIVIRTPYRSRGYLRAESEPSRFVPNPLRLAEDAEDVVYRSGDLGRYRPDGKISILGRNDDQLKIRGARIEPQEVAAVLENHPAVVHSFVAAPIVHGKPVLTGYIVCGDREPSQRELRSYLLERLSWACVPTQFITLQRLPLTPNGKVDRRALPMPTVDSNAQFVEPRTPLQRQLTSIWQEVLGIDRVSTTDDFFRLGGHSLLAAKAVSRISCSCDVDIPILAIFEHPTVVELAEFISDFDPEVASSDHRELKEHCGGAVSCRPLEDDVNEVSNLTARRLDAGVAVQLSFGQQRMWLLDRLLPNPAAYNGPLAIRLEGAINPQILAKALTEIVRRHQSLRTVVRDGEGRVLQAFEVDLPMLDLSTRPDELESALFAESNRPFDLSRDLMLRARLFRLSDHEHVLLLVLHHISSDGWSRGVLARELSELYRAYISGQSSPLQDLPVQYSDHATQQRERLQGEVLERHLSYWRKQLAGASHALQLPTDRPRPPVQSFRGAAYTSTVPQPIVESLRNLSCEEGSTLFFTTLAAFKTMLFRYSRQHDIVVGSPIAGRSSVDVESLIGFFVNTLALRTNMDGAETFRDLLRSVRQTVLDAMLHQELPFDRLVEELDVERDLSRNPVCQAMFAFQNMPRHPFDFPGVQATRLPVDNKSSKSDLVVSAWNTDDGLRMNWEYNTDLFDATTIERMAANWTTLLASIARQPDCKLHRLEMTPAPERQRVLRDWNQTARPSSELLVERFESQVAGQSARIAVVDADTSLTYGQLNARANQVARLLQQQGVASGDRVAVQMERSADLLATLLAVLKCGAAYVPLDSDHPRQRSEMILSEAKPSLLVVDAVCDLHADGLKTIDLAKHWQAVEQQSPENLGEAIDAEQMAYMLFTSGSTGRPKGVMTPHRGVANFLHSMQREPGMCPDDVALALTTVCFDISVLELFLPLFVGARVVIADRSTVVDGMALGQLIQQHDVSLLQATPATWRILLESGWRPKKGVRLLSGGEALPLDLAQRLTESGAELWNMYGPTETTVYSTISRVEPGCGVTIGRPIDNTSVYVLDQHGQPTPIGVPGELHIGGRGVALGYWRRDDLTAARFVDDPFANDGSRMYRTGDQVRWLAEGQLEFLGRQDGQIKLRGYRIELGEIEQAMLEHEPIAHCAVISRGSGDDQQLVAYFVREGEGPEEHTLRQHLAEKLPSYMMPSAFVELPELPLTPSGKINTKALPEPTRCATTRELVAPANETEQRLAGIWQELLGLDAISVEDDFFLSGGHSLKATQVVARIAAQWNVDLPLRSVFEAPTIRQLAWQIDQQLPSTDACEASSAELRPLTNDGPTPASYAQQRLWFIDRLETEAATYHMPLIMRLHGPVDTAALEQALAEIVRRHECLRTVLEMSDDQLLQRVKDDSLKLSLIDVSHDPDSLEGMVSEAIQRPFDLSRDLMLRATLFQEGPQRGTLLLVLHHIAADGWSLAVLRRELSALYEAYSQGQPSPLPPLPLQYKDFTRWQRVWGDQRLSQQAAFWRRALKDAPTLDLPADRPRPPQPSLRGASRRLVLPTDVVDRLRKLAQRENATLYSVVLAAFKTLLARYSGHDDIVVGSPVAGRTRSEVEGLIGCFVNTIVLRTNLAGAPTFRELVRRTQQTAVSAMENQDLPFEHLVEELQPDRDLSRHPLFQVMFTLQNMSHEELKLPHVRVTPQRADLGAAKYDLTLLANETDNGLEVTWNYSTDLFDATTIQRMAEHWNQMIVAAADDPDCSIDELPWLEAWEQQTLEQWSRAQRDYARDAGLVELFRRHVESAPDRVAIVGEGTTYAELEHRSSRLAAWLQTHDLQLGVPIAIRLDRGVDLVVAQLAVLKTGSPYVPLDASSPPQRLNWMLEDCQAQLLITDRNLEVVPTSFAGPKVYMDEPCQWSQHPVSESHDVGCGGDLAYIMYTSGSTGRPKGVAVPQRAVTRLVTETNYVQLGPDDVVAQASNVAFDAATFELWGALLNGGRLSIVDPDVLLSPTQLRAHLEQDGVTAMFVTTALFNQIAEQAPDTFGSLKHLLVGGEAVTAEFVRQVLRAKPPERLINGYGPTESTTFATWHLMQRIDEDQATAPIGQPINNTDVWVLDKRGQLAPIGVPGEIFIGGDGLATGYWRDPDLTSQRFVPNPLDGGATRLYRTGDLAKWRADGCLEFLGRRDKQVKLRGFRIELGEIEAALAAHVDIASSVAVVEEAASLQKRLIAYYVPKAEGLAIGELRAHLAETLPDYMIPAAFVSLPALPLNANGKVDRGMLPKPAVHEAMVAPRTPIESKLAGIWCDVIGLEEVGIDDNFFELGGHSLLGVRLFSRIERAFRVCLPMSILFRSPTIAQLAVEIEHASDDKGMSLQGRRIVPIREEDSPKAPVFCIHGGGGHVMGYHQLAMAVGDDRSFYGIEPVGIEGRELPQDEVGAMAASYLQEIRAAQPTGPYYLCGYSFGGLIAYEVAWRLRNAGEEVAMLALLDTHLSKPASGGRRLRRLFRQARAAACRPIYRLCQSLHATVPFGIRKFSIREACHRAARSYQPEPYEGTITFFLAEHSVRMPDVRRWRQLADHVEVLAVPTRHAEMLRSAELAQSFAMALDRCA